MTHEEATQTTRPTGAQVDGVVERARRAAPAIARLTVGQRCAHLQRLREVVLARREEIIDRVRTETGKSRSDILMSEVFGVLDALAWLEDNAQDALADEKIPTPLTLMGKKSRVWYEPRGVVFVISPWNYPFFQALVPIASAYAAGNAVVYKPSEHTPLEGLVESLLEDAGFAPSHVQVVYGDGAVGSAVIDQRPDQVMFTGSTRTGRKILAQAAQHLIPCELELGGKDPMIVFEDVEIERTVAGAAFGALTATGQSCTSVERLYVHESIHDRFVDALVDHVSRLTQADTPAEDNDLGRMTTDFQVEVVAQHVRDAKDRGATFRTGGDWDGTDPVIPPMVVTDLPEDALMAVEETFGPVIPVFRFSDEDEVVARANDTVYGLTASVWSGDLERAERVARALRCGGVSVNNVMATEATPALPFGGLGQSGYGRYKGVHGLRTFCNAKSVILDKDGDKIEANWYPYTGEKYRLFTKMMVANFTDSPLRLARFGVLGTKLEGLAKKARRP